MSQFVGFLLYWGMMFAIGVVVFRTGIVFLTMILAVVSNHMQARGAGSDAVKGPQILQIVATIAVGGAFIVFLGFLLGLYIMGPQPVETFLQKVCQHFMQGEGSTNQQQQLWGLC